MSTHAPQSQASLLKNVLIITPLSLIGRAGTFLIYVVLANWFGDPAEMDFIYYYWGIAVFLIELLSAASAYSVLVPMLAEARAKGETEAQRCVQSIFSQYIIFMPGTLLPPRLRVMGYFPTFFTERRATLLYDNRHCVWIPLLRDHRRSPLDAQGNLRHLPSLSFTGHCARAPCYPCHRRNIPVQAVSDLV